MASKKKKPKFPFTKKELRSLSWDDCHEEMFEDLRKMAIKALDEISELEDELSKLSDRHGGM